MFDPEFIKWLATLGVGGALAGVMFMFYRKDVATYTHLWKGQSEALLEVVKDNTQAITELIGMVEALLRQLEVDRAVKLNNKRNRGDGDG